MYHSFFSEYLLGHSGMYRIGRLAEWTVVLSLTLKLPEELRCNNKTKYIIFFSFLNPMSSLFFFLLLGII